MQCSCPNCGQSYEVKTEEVGKSFQCAHCGAQFRTVNPNLMPCPDCFGMVSKRAAVCPHCGAPLQAMAEAAREEAPEKMVGVYHPAAIYYLWQLLGGVLLLVGALLMAAFFRNAETASVAVPLGIMGFGVLVTVYIHVKFTIYELTTKRIVIRTGWLNKNRREIWIKDMRGVNLVRSLWQRIVGTGSIAIGTAATAGTEIHIVALRHAEEVVDCINSLRKS